VPADKSKAAVNRQKLNTSPRMRPHYPHSSSIWQKILRDWKIFEELTLHCDTLEYPVRVIIGRTAAGFSLRGWRYLAAIKAK
jgi:hypothetical protein